MSSSIEEPWPGDWNRASLGLCALQALTGGPSYGYAIITALEDAGLGTIKGGTLYPLLDRLERDGLVAVEWRPGDGGPGRKYFALTADGRLYFDNRSARWSEFTRRTHAFIRSTEGN